MTEGGYEIVYTGQGGRNEKGIHIKDQELKRGNLALVKNELEGLPIRVIRGAHKKSTYAPPSGYRYDGLYRVDSHWSEVGNSGFKIWRYRLLKIEDDSIDIERTDPTNPLALGSNTKPIRKISMVQRIVRDTEIAKGVKKHYDYACQVCGMKIPTAGGFYAEAAHIRALGSPHSGPDTSDNIICLCPNHHVMFDQGVFSISDDLTLIGLEGKLYVSPGHEIISDHLKYHRDHYFSKK